MKLLFNKLSTIVFFLLSFLFLVPIINGKAYAATYYVSGAGSNSANGSIGSPWQTVQYAVDHVNAGDSITLRDGTYNENVVITRSGSAGSVITLTEYSGESATINGGTGIAIQSSGAISYWTISNLNIYSTNALAVRFGWWSENTTNHITLSGNYVQGAVFTVGNYQVFENNEMDGTGYTAAGGYGGINDSHGGQGDNATHHNIYRNNYIHDYTNYNARGIWTQGRTHDNTIDNNRIENIWTNGLGQCIDADAGATTLAQWRQTITNNTITDCSYVGIQLENVFVSTVQNNTIFADTGGNAGIIDINYTATVGCGVGGDSNEYGDTDSDNSCKGAITNNVIRQNLIYKRAAWGWGYGGVVNWGAGGLTIENNTIYAGSAGGNAAINFQDTAANTSLGVIKNNILYNGNGVAICARELASFSTDTNNLLYRSNSDVVYGVGTSCGTTTYTLAAYQAATEKGTNSVQSDPLFNNLANFNFHLLASSPAIDMAASTSLTLDIEDNPRPAGSGYDAGSYEYVISDSPVTLTVNQATGQVDPSSEETINFTVIFSESVSNFSASDVTIAGTANATTAVVTGSGTTYNVAISGMSVTGTVVLTIGSSVVTGANSNINSASTSIDNSISYVKPAVTYYVDATNGSDSNDGTSTNLAWKTISKVNSSTFAAGDQILFKKGESWDETLTVSSSGTSTSYITFGSYGTGAKPRISGSTALTNWDNTIAAGVGNLVDENYEGTGYEESWTELVGDGSIVDEDSTEVTRPTGGGNQILKLQKVSPNYNARSRRDMGSEQNVIYARMYVYIGANSSAGQNIVLMRGVNGASTVPWAVNLTKTAASEDRFSFSLYNNGTTTTYSYPSGASGTGGINLNQWYKVEVKYDVTNTSWEWRVDETAVNSGALTGTLRNPARLIDIGDAAQTIAMTAYFDRVAIDTAGYLSEASTLPENIWKTSYSSSPPAVWLNQSGNISHGKLETSIPNLTVANEYYQSGTNLYLYSVSDPDSAYTSVDVAARDGGIDLNGKEYVIIDGFEIKNNSYWGIRTANSYDGANNIIRNNTIHHIGSKNAALAEGILLRKGNNQVVSNTLYEIGTNGISILANGASDTVSSVNVEGNTIYNIYHNAISLQNTQGTVSSSTIKNNLIYTTSAYDTTYASSGIFLGGTSGNNISTLTVVSNILYDIASIGIEIGQYTTNSNIYNNTCYQTLSTYTDSSNCYTSSATGTSGLVFKNNIGVASTTYPVLDVASKDSFTTLDYNLWYQSSGNLLEVDSTAYTASSWESYKSTTGFDAHSPTPANPLFTNTAANDFHLLAASPARNAGSNTSMVADYNGTALPKESIYDLGAYEYIPLTVTINRKNAQNDPTSTSPINFTVVFSESVSDFATGDVTLSGTAGATTGTVTGSSTTYNIAVTGMTQSGTVVVSIVENKATGATSNTNNASTSTDNTVTYDISNPVISATSSNPASTESTITWTTDEDSSSKVDFGLTDSYGSSTLESDTSQRISSHSVGLTGLSACTTYHYRVRSTDGLGNEGVGSDNTFVTAGCASSSSSSSSSSRSSDLSCDKTSPKGAPLLWGATTKGKDSILLQFDAARDPVEHYALEFGTEQGKYIWGAITIGDKATREYLVKSLSPNTRYYFRVRAGNGCAAGKWSEEISATTWGYVSTNKLEITDSELTINENSARVKTNSCQSYTVKSGDTLKSIAQKELGDEKRYKEIIEQNKDKYPTLETSNNLNNGWELKLKCEDSQKDSAKLTETNKGYLVKVKVTYNDGRAVAGAKVTIHSDVQEAITNKEGIAEFSNIEPGAHRVIITYGKYEGEQSINLTGDVKEFVLNVTVQEKPLSISPVAIGILSLMSSIIITILVQRKRRKQQRHFN